MLVSATSTVSLKVHNIFKPIQLDDNSVKIEIQSEQLGNNPNGIISIINNDDLGKKLQVSYEDSEADVPNFITLKEVQNAVTTDYFDGVDKLDENYVKSENNNLLNNEKNFVKPSEVEKKSEK
ncbi:hypothetical protein NQ314_021449 [Rhamnusium bicolor]|uniref:Uncharacterized protein n=1 Tax=Rhamnusium bicolor TaxID=1586634 RepID=A0AAV8WIL6_9CUCU|nr:hypothetical protein NQ314_021449 [Rhamnusium bicolor]